MLAGPHNHDPRRRTGFSLVELLVSLGLMGILTLALLTSFTFIARGDQSLSNYGEMNAQARLLLEKLGSDLRSANDVDNFSATSIMLKVPTNPAVTATKTVIWSCVADTDPRYLNKMKVIRSEDSVEKIYARDVSTFSFYYANGNNVATTSLVEVKQVQVSLRMLRLVASTVTSEYVISTQFTMRAKSTTQ